MHYEWTHYILVHDHDAPNWEANTSLRANRRRDREYREQRATVALQRSRVEDAVSA